jgi:hypothetical protein
MVQKIILLFQEIILSMQVAWNTPNSLPKKVFCFMLWVFVISSISDMYAVFDNIN